MNVIIWIFQVALALMLLAGGSYKLFKVDALAKTPSGNALPRSAWRAIGAVEMVCGFLLVIPALAPLAAAVIVVESLFLAAIYARHSLAVKATNPLVYVVPIALVAAFIAYGRYALR